MTGMRVLLTGFEPYGGRSLNPAFETMQALHGRAIAGADLVGRAPSVSLTQLGEVMAQPLAAVGPHAVITRVLWPGESMIRLERIGINVADFEIADNE